MAILEDTVEVKIGSRSFKHYNDLGYNVKNGDIITVPIEHLTPFSCTPVTCICDECGDTKILKYRIYTMVTEKNDGKYYCKKCTRGSDRVLEKIKKTNINKYGVYTTLLVPEVKEKIKATNIERYGTEYPRQNEKVAEKYYNTIEERYGSKYVNQIPEIQEKQRQGCIDRYGVPYCTQSPIVQEKIKQTNIERYGVPNLSQNPEIRAKAVATMIERYGVPYSGQSPELREKQVKTFQKNGTVFTSKQQRYLWHLYGGVLNGAIGVYNCDIVFYDKKYIIEFDGSGHNLNVKKGIITQEEFDNKQKIRFYAIKREGFKQIRIISRKDKLPSDDILKDIVKKSEEYFSTTEHTWINWDIDGGCFYNILNQNGTPYDYGPLRIIRKEGDDNNGKYSYENTNFFKRIS